MTTDETTAPLWVPERDYLPREDRSVIRSLRQGGPGVGTFDDFVTAPGTGWNVVVGPGRAIVDGTTSPWTQGSYALYAPTSRTIPVQAPHANLRRYDIVVLHVYDQENSTEQGFRWRREVVTGTPGSGNPPPLPPNSRPLRGLDIPGGQTGGLNANNLITFWPYWHNSDLRRPVGPVLMQTHDHKNWWGNYPFGNGAQWRPFWFDLQIPTNWRALALWPFETIVEVQIEVHVVGWWSYGQRVEAWYWSPSRPGYGWIWSLDTLYHAHQVHMSFTDTFLVAPNQPPWWDFILWSRPGEAWDVDCVAHTRIVPRGPTTHRIGNGGAQW